jgi:hypothetical protein
LVDSHPATDEFFPFRILSLGMANSRTSSYLWRRLAVTGLFAVAWSPLSVVSGSSSSSTMTSSTMQRDSATCADGGPDTLEQAEPSFSLDTSEVIVRFFFIRHAQTEANDELIVVGQGDSVSLSLLLHLE